MSVSVVMAAGGTGGHLVPALAIATAVRRAQPDARICFIGTRRGLEAEMVPAAGYRVHMTSMQPFSRDARGALAGASMVPATWQARSILKRERASVVIGMGGYASLPAIVAARLGGVASLIHEANALPGLANEVAARFTRNVAVTFPATARAFGARDVRVTGMPLREAIGTFDRDALRSEALAHFALDPERRTLLVFGGSLGAARLARAAADLGARWAKRDDVQLIVIAGAHTADATATLRAAGIEPEAPAGGGLIARVRAFVDRMELAYAAADLAVARAGASTVCELAAVGVPSVLVPYPHARRREQHANARLLTEPGAATLVEDADVSGERLEIEAGALLDDPARRARMSDAARAVARPHAAAEVAAWALELAGVRP